ncbi:MAG: sulfurtransferase TusA family protein [Caldilinea sp.]|nr:sulfurtransferase TusA family protein [Caldilinea sp.]MDW8440249.1 sulfurtransferase TusA family protein [Caldilineaceae bacterium]
MASIETATIQVDQELDVRGLNCPMPLVKARQAILKLDVGRILKVISTDRGSVKDFQGWAKAANNVTLLAQSEETDSGGKTLYLHYVQRTK